MIFQKNIFSDLFLFISSDYFFSHLYRLFFGTSGFTDFLSRRLKSSRAPGEWNWETGKRRSWLEEGSEGEDSVKIQLQLPSDERRNDCRRTMASKAVNILGIGETRCWKFRWLERSFGRGGVLGYSLSLVIDMANYANLCLLVRNF